MPWLNNIISAVTGNKVDVEEVKRKIKTSKPKKGELPVTDAELQAYVDDIKSRINKMVKDLRTIYGKFGIEFSGFKALDSACVTLRDGLKGGKDDAYNNLIKLESSITAEQRRHVALIKMAVSKDGKKVIDQITQNPSTNAKFAEVFGKRDATGKENMDGTYQQLWSEIHKLSEYIIVQKNKVYH